MNTDGVSQNPFDTSHLTEDLKNRSIRGTFLFAGARFFNALMQIGSTAILARLILPKDFGLVAMVLVGLNLLMNFRDAGLSTATIQRKNIDQSQVSALFWINTLLGFSLATIMFFMAPLFSWFYKEPKLTAITYFLALILIFDGLSVQHRALLQRQMLYRRLAIIQIFSQTSGKIVAIIMAFLGFGYWALVALPVATSGIRFVLLWIFGKWIPNLPAKAKNLKEMLTFGIHLTGTNFISFFHQQLDSILIGRFCGPFALGLYSKSYNLVSLPFKFIIWPADDVLIPSLSVLQNNPEKYRRFLKKALEKLNFFGQPITIFMFIASEEIILILLGKHWYGAIPIFRILGIWAFCMITQTGSYVILISVDKTRRLLTWESIRALATIISIIIGLYWGVMGVAAALAVSCLLIKPLEILYCYQGTPFKLSDFWDATWFSLISSVISGICLYLLRVNLLNKIENIYLRLPVMALTFGAIYIMIGLSLPNGRKKIKDLIQKFTGLVKKDLTTNQT